ncbi:phosphotriesterase [Spirosoma sp. HMF4905]|uniref:Phosphotriesterase n=1 Tax=Spirosoma arboris TaxID=2682092 RepID=A0A7K1SHD0_9BACT|nr:phosphotriesterase [Spirosoma arboris]MVM33217.1 phosphotriesterase [Spirosoma arboris]
MLSRRNFIQKSVLAGVGLYTAPKSLLTNLNEQIVMTVKGPIRPRDMQFTLTHEHVLADFIGAEKYSRDRYKVDEVYARALPFLQDVKNKGCVTFIDCSPAYLGRDVQLLKRLADSTKLHIITNTGYYGAVNERFLPKHVYTESARQLADRWIAEWTDGVEGTGIKPGFIKTSVDQAPLTVAQRKIIEAAALTHLATGLTIAVHTDNGEAANEQLRILADNGVAPSARIWVHAQKEQNMAFHIDAAKRKSWVSYDGVNPRSIKDDVTFLQRMKANGLLNQVLVSQDSGWYNVGEPNGGNYRDYLTIFTLLIPSLKRNGFSSRDIHTLFVENPANAFSIQVRKL